MEEAYTVFADIYDEFMNNIPYEKWCENVCHILAEYGRNGGIKSGIIAELGCGTGVMTRLMSKAGFDMIGIDNSEDMLAIAREENEEAYADAEAYLETEEEFLGTEEELLETEEEFLGIEEDFLPTEASEGLEKTGPGKGILYLLQDMRDLELYGTVDAVISVCDSMNYLTCNGDLGKVLKKVNLYLERDGLFVFDMKTDYCYSHILGDSVQYEESEDCSLIWENHYDRESGIHSYDLTMFIAYEDNDTYEKYKETHIQRAYTVEEVKGAVQDAGMELLAVLDAETLGKPDDKTKRVYYITKEKFQKNKKYI